MWKWFLLPLLFQLAQILSVCVLIIIYGILCLYDRFILSDIRRVLRKHPLFTLCAYSGSELLFGAIQVFLLLWWIEILALSWGTWLLLAAILLQVFEACLKYRELQRWLRHEEEMTIQHIYR